MTHRKKGRIKSGDGKCTHCLFSATAKSSCAIARCSGGCAGTCTRASRCSACEGTSSQTVSWELFSSSGWTTTCGEQGSKKQSLLVRQLQFRNRHTRGLQRRMEVVPIKQVNTAGVPPGARGPAPRHFAASPPPPGDAKVEDEKESFLLPPSHWSCLEAVVKSFNATSEHGNAVLWVKAVLSNLGRNSDSIATATMWNVNTTRTCVAQECAGYLPSTRCKTTSRRVYRRTRSGALTAISRAEMWLAVLLKSRSKAGHVSNGCNVLIQSTATCCPDEHVSLFHPGSQGRSAGPWML